MELSDEMKEAIRILREDGQIASYNKMTQSHQELVQRLDHVEDNWSEFRASQKEKETDPSEPEKGGTGGDNPSDPPTPPSGPQPPPVKEPDPEPVKKGRTPWWERGGYDTSRT